MRAHLIKDDIVVNTVEIQSLADASTFWPDLEAIEATEGGIGWTYSNGVFTAPPPPPELPPPTAPTKEQLLAQLQTLAAQIQALE